MGSDHLFGAFGMFWDRANVDWSPGGGPQAWQLLGVSGGRTPTVCDFRLARGFYLLFDDHGAHYVGIARGSQGLGYSSTTPTSEPGAGSAGSASTMSSPRHSTAGAWWISATLLARLTPSLWSASARLC